MASQKSQGTSSPSASSIFLPLGRHSRRGSVASYSTQAERENLNEALDQIHNAACHSNTLTVFNEFTNPPVPSSATDNKPGVVGDLQGGLSGLYSLLRASVGGVKDIVGGTTKTADPQPAEPVSSKPLHGSSQLSLSGLGSVGNQPSPSNSTHGSKAQSPVSGTFVAHHEGITSFSAPRCSKVSSKAPSVSSKSSIPSSTALKTSLAPLTKLSNPVAADPTVTEINANAIRPTPHPNVSHSGSLSAGNHTRPDPTVSDRADGSVQTSSLHSSQEIGIATAPRSSEQTSSLSSDTHPAEGRGRAASITSYSQGILPYEKVLSPAKAKMVDIASEQAEFDPPFQGVHSRSSNAATTSVDPSPVQNSVTNGPARLSTAGDSKINDARLASATMSVSKTDRETLSGQPSKPLLGQPRGRPAPRISQSRLPGYGLSRILSSDSFGVHSTTALPHVSFDTPKPVRATHTAGKKSRDSSHPRRNNAVPPNRKLLSRDYWMRDENAKDCFHCGEPFSTFRRKHHCRTCGQIFDSKCTCIISGAPFGHSGSIRVCKPCEAVLNAHDSDSSDCSADELSPVVFDSRVSETAGNGPKVRLPMEDDDTSSAVSQSVEQVLKAPTMAIPATRRTVDGNNRRSAILEIESDRPLTRPTSSRSLRSSLNGRTLSVSHKRHHSRAQYVRGLKSYHEERAPFQRRMWEEVPSNTRLHAFHRDNIIDPDIAQYLSDDASSADEQPSLFSVVSDNALTKNGGEGEKASFGGFLAAVKKGRSRFGDRTGQGPSSNRELDEGSVTSSRAVNPGRSTRRRNLSVASSIHQRLSPRPPKENTSIVHYFHDAASPNLSTIPASPSSGFKMTRSSSMRGAGAPPIELNRASLLHVRKLLRQLLKDASVPHWHSWETALLPILLKATDDVEPDVQHGDDMDIRHYVKLKKIPGGRPGDTSYVSGLVFTKNLALKSMPRSIPRPNILIITFPLEYARQQQHFMSLEPVIRQEREFLENLVGRISALRPNVLLVEKNVSGLALELLEKAGIATAYNVKPSVIEAVSRCTRTKIINSMDRLVAAPSYPGQCGSFDVKTYVYNGRKKTYMYISGCSKELGCTIVLRGANNDVLVKLKRITEFMVYVVYNLKLETCLMRDEFAKIPTSSQNIVQQRDVHPVSITSHLEARLFESSKDSGTKEIPAEDSHLQKRQQGEEEDMAGPSSTLENIKVDVSQDTPAPAFYEDMVQKHQTKILSASPFVQFQQPYLLMRARELERQLAYLKRLRDQDFASNTPSDEAGKSQKFVLITPSMIHQSPSGASEKVKEVLHAVHDAEYDRALYNYQTQKRQWETYISGNINLFDPYAHQNIVVLYSLVCTTTSVPCSGPDIFALDFYNDHVSDRIFEADCTLGQYVEDLCQNANIVCTVNGCEERMFDHHQQYVHGDAQISIFVQPYPSKLRGLQDTILMWSCCKICGNETPAMPMSDSTWKYSFGKYLELSFSSADLHVRAGVCSHDLHRDHLRYFGYKDVALRIHYDPITLLEIIVPRPRVTWKVDKDLRLRNEIFTKAEQRLTRFMNSVKARLRGINVDSVVPEMAQSCQDEVEVLMKRANDEHAALLKQHQEMYMNSKYWQTIPLNRVILSMQEKVVEWDATFADFERNYFPSETDIKRLATLQLKRIFLDKDVSVTSLTSGDENAATPSEPSEPGTDSETSPALTRRMTLSPQQAKSVLASVVEEHSGKPAKHDEDEEHLSPPLTPKAGAALLPETTQISQEAVQHLDLAIPNSIAERLSPPRDNSNLVTISEHVHDIPTPLPDTTQAELASITPRPSPPNEISEELTNEDDAQELSTQTPTKARPSGIPRLFTEKPARRTLRAKSPPLLRTQSQPVHLQKERSLSGRFSPAYMDQVRAPVSRQDSAFLAQNEETRPKVEKRLSERLGLSSLKSNKSSGPSLIPRSIPSKYNSKVSSLARHFEQLSREFEKERQRERKQRAAQGKQSRAYPMASSNPVMEVYKSVKDAVDPSDEDFLSNLPSMSSSKESSSLTEKRNSDRPVEQPQKTEGPRLNTDLQPRPSEEFVRDDSVTPSEAGTGVDGDGEQSESERCLLEDFQSNEDANTASPDEISLELKELPKHERSSLVKMLANFWAERSASGWAPLDYPLNDSDHVFADCDIIVREDEPSSLIAFALDSSDYKHKIRSIQETNEKAQSEIRNDSEIADIQADVEHSLLRSTGTHLKYQFQEGNAKMVCKIFYAEQFDALRRKCGVSERIVESLSRCMKWDSKGGKTKSLFLKTLDERFILKSLSTVETQAFLKFAPAYFQIMSEALFHELPSAIAKMFGFYQVIMKNPTTGVEFNWFLLLMENLFYDRNPTRIFDLKGSMRNRKVEITGEQNEVLLDENMVEFIYESPLFTREHSKKLLSQSVWNDTLFLERQNVMDYSLMIAIDESRQELVVGIIDCIRTYTWDKKLESWIKDRGFAGGSKNRPTVTSPKEYKNRFREAMARYVLQAPK